MSTAEKLTPLQLLSRPLTILKLIFFLIIFISYFLIISGYWIALDIEDYAEWFYIIPLLFLSFSIFYHILLSLGLLDRFDFYLRYDTYTYLLLPTIPIVLSLKTAIPSWWYWFGAYYTGILVLKAYFLLRYLYDNIDTITKKLDIKGKLSIFLVFLIIYLFISIWVCNNYPPDGDEPHYLILAHSLIYDHDFDSINNYNNEDYLAFYPYPLNPQGFGFEDGTYIPTQNFGLPILIMLPYYLGGRAGVVLLINIITSLLMLNLFLLIFEIFKKPKIALLTTCIAAFSSPILFYSSQIFPETTSALLVLVCYRYLRKCYFENLFKISYVFLLTGCSIALLMIKLRYIFIAIPLLILLILKNVNVKKIKQLVFVVLSILIPSTVIAIIIYLLKDHLPIGRQFVIRTNELFRTGFKDIVFLDGFLGIFIDKQFGLLIYSPIFIFSFLGLTTFRKLKPREFYLAATTTFLYFVAIATIPWWHGGWCPPSRFMVILIPFLCLGLAQSYDRISSLKRIAVVRFLIVITGINSVIFTLFPILRYNIKTGSNHLLDLAGRSLGIDIDKLFPSYILPNSSNNIWSLIFITFLLFIFIKPLVRKNETQETSGTKSVDFLTSGLAHILSMILIILCLSFFIFLSFRVPTTIVEFENLPLSKIDPPTEVYINDGRKLFPSLPVEFFTITREGKQHITIIARTDNWPNPPPLLEVSLDNVMIAKLSIDAQRWSSYYINQYVKAGTHKWTLTYNGFDQNNIDKFAETFKIAKKLYSEKYEVPPPRLLEIDKIIYQSDKFSSTISNYILGHFYQLIGNDLKALNHYAILLNFDNNNRGLGKTLIKLCIKHKLYGFIADYFQNIDKIAYMDIISDNDAYQITKELISRKKYPLACQLITTFGIDKITDVKFINLAALAFIDLDQTDLVKKLISKKDFHIEDSEQIHYILGMIKLKDGDEVAATEEFNKAILSEGTCNIALMQLKSLFEKQGKTDALKKLESLSLKNMTRMIHATKMNHTSGESNEDGSFRLSENSYLQSPVCLPDGYSCIKVEAKGKACFETPKVGFVAPYVYPNLEVILDDMIIDKVEVRSEKDWSQFTSIMKVDSGIHDLKLQFPNFYFYEKDQNKKYLDIKDISIFKLDILFPENLGVSRDPQRNWVSISNKAPLYFERYIPGSTENFLFKFKLSEKTKGIMHFYIDDFLHFEQEMSENDWVTKGLPLKINEGDHRLKLTFDTSSNRDETTTVDLAWIIITYK
jgi:hypothetical protein